MTTKKKNTQAFEMGYESVGSETVDLTIIFKKKKLGGTSLVVQWLRLHAPNAGGSGSFPGQGNRPHMLQLRVCMLQLRVRCFS